MKLAPSLFFFLGVLLSAGNAGADNPNVRHVSVVSNEPLISAYALIVADRPTKGGESNTREAVITKGKNSSWQLTVVLKPEDLTAGVRYTAVAVTKSGRVLPSEVQWVIEPEVSAFVSTRCTENINAEEDKQLSTLSKEELETLAQIRQTRAQILAKKLRETLDIQAIAQLTALEHDLGFSYARTLSKDLPLGELAYRIAVIEATLRSR